MNKALLVNSHQIWHQAVVIFLEKSNNDENRAETYQKFHGLKYLTSYKNVHLRLVYNRWWKHDGQIQRMWFYIQIMPVLDS